MSKRPEQVRIREATMDDLASLVEMNRQLIEDEQYDQARTDKMLVDRISDRIIEGSSVFLFSCVTDSSLNVGYAAIELAKDPAYLAQFFICREHRRRGYGQAAFSLLLDHLSIESVDVEVMAWNQAGLKFWRSLGFRHRYEGFRLERDDSTQRFSP